MNQKIKAVVFDVGGVLCEYGRKFTGVCKNKKWTRKINRSVFKVFIWFKDGSDLGFMTTDEFFDQLTRDLGVPEKAKEWRKGFVPGFKRIEPSF